MRCDKEKFLIWGTGKYSQYLMDEIRAFSWESSVVSFVDTDSVKWGQSFYGKIIEAPNIIYQEEFTKIIIAIADYDSVYHRLITEFKIAAERIDNIFFYQRERFIDYYDGLPMLNKEQRAVLEMVKKKPMNVFNFEETLDSEKEDLSVMYDESCGLFYCIYDGKRMYLSKKFDSMMKATRYLASLIREQNEHSPHRYLTDDFDVHDGDVVLDAGVAEGNFSLTIIDRVAHLYIVEADEEWIEPLQRTFAPYADKVEIIKGFLSDIDCGNEKTIDGIVGLNRLDFLKLDIEGAEITALTGGRHTLCDNDVRMAVCTYHREGDYDNICRILREYGYTTNYRPGYMIFMLANQLRDYRVPKCVRGVVCAQKDTKPKIVIYGAGKFLKQVYDDINQDLCYVIAIADEDSKKNGHDFYDHRIISLSSALELNPDYVVISSTTFASDMRATCERMGVPGECIICYWDIEKKYSFLRRTSALKYENEKLKIRIENAPYEFGKLEVPTVRPAAELLRLLIDEHKSLIRFGDGEFECMMMRTRPWFQSVNERLAEKLNEALHTHDDRILVAIADDFDALDQYTDDAADGIRKYITDGTRQKIYDVLEKGRIYYDAYVTRPYIIYRNKNHAKCIFTLFKELFYKRKVLIVEGWNSRFGCGSDLLMGTSSVKRVRCPAKDAFDFYDEILKSIKKNASHDVLILVSLGPTATVLSYDLAKIGYQAIDIGQLDNEYDWYNMGTQVRRPIRGKCVAEVAGAHDIINENEDYKVEVVAEIKG